MWGKDYARSPFSKQICLPNDAKIPTAMNVHNVWNVVLACGLLTIVDSMIIVRMPLHHLNMLCDEFVLFRI
jgi:hypothetical protein